MNICKRMLAAMLALALCCGASVATAASAPTEVEALITDAAAYLHTTVKAPQVGTIGGEWAVLGLARSGYPAPVSYYQDYLATVEAYVRACKGILHEKKYTEYSRVIVALSALGQDARAVAGYDLTTALGDYEKTIWQGLNGPIWALIALDSRNYPMPQTPGAKTQATRQMYVERILECQNQDGGWSLQVGGTSDPDITGMALQALAKYRGQPAVDRAVEAALTCMSRTQEEDGGFSVWGVKNSESCVQMLVALCELNLPLTDARFVKNGKTLLDNLCSFRVAGAGFLHTVPASGSDLMASEQGLYALAAVKRMEAGENSLYRMDDAVTIPAGDGTRPEKGVGLAGRHADVKARPIQAPGATFEDISGHKFQSDIEALAARGIISGKGSGGFDPNGDITRAEFAAIVVNALGLPVKAGKTFGDVAAREWYASAVETAAAYGLVDGGGDGTFRPLDAVTRQEAAVLMAHAAKLCGMDVSAQERVLTQFTDRVDCAGWARPALAFCYERDLLNRSDVRIRPTENATRGEVAQMLFRLLGAANLL